jgi:rhodanese-related sulfurtransferase
MKKILFVVALFLFVGALPALAAEVPRMTKDDLKKAMLDSAEIAILDARAGKDWKSSEFKIKGAIRTPIDKIDEWVSSIPKEKKLIIYCA